MCPAILGLHARLEQDKGNRKIAFESKLFEIIKKLPDMDISLDNLFNLFIRSVYIICL